MLCRDAAKSLKRNIFVETALSFALSYISTISKESIAPSNVTILADNDYYSTSGSLLTGSRFHKFNVPIEKAAKTGLGSSAALVTAFVAAVLSFYLPQSVFDLNTDVSRSRLHNLAQAAHCTAQGKVGSGFDIASAVYGSCQYRRFSPDILTTQGEAGSRGFAQRLHEIVTNQSIWDAEIRPDAVQIPKGLRLVMCDVNTGSQTPGMVKQVLAWQAREGSSAEELLDRLHACNMSTIAELTRLACSPQFARNSARNYAHLRECINKVRRHIRELSARSGVPVEPPEQTRLLDVCSGVTGVIGGTTPGAGGHDAVALLIEDRDEVMTALQEALACYRYGDAKHANVSIMRVRQGSGGVMPEDAAAYAALM